jgi:hypothetical protein
VKAVSKGPVHYCEVRLGIGFIPAARDNQVIDQENCAPTSKDPDSPTRSGRAHANVSDRSVALRHPSSKLQVLPPDDSAVI